VAIVLTEGFDLLTTNDVAAKYPSGAQFSPAMSAGRFSGQSYNPGTGNQNGEWVLRFTGQAAFTFGIAHYVTSTQLGGASTGVRIARFREAGDSTQAELRLAANGQLLAYNGPGSALLGSSAAGVITADTFHYIEVEFVLSDTVGVFKVYVNGVQVINVTGADTKAQSSAVVTNLSFTFSGNGNGGQRYDDFYLTDTAARLGESRIETLSPSADTATKNWGRSAGSDNFALVDEKPSDGDTTYVTATTAGTADLYDMADLSEVPLVIHAVQSSIIGRKDDAATRAVRCNLKSGGTTANGTALGLTTSYVQRVTLYATDPDTGSAWTASGVNALQAGPEVTV